MKVLKLLDSEEKWTKHFYARNKDGIPVSVRHPGAYSFCLLGAVRFCYGEIGGVPHKRLFDAIGYSLDAFNDDDATTFADIRRVLIEANV